MVLKRVKFSDFKKGGAHNFVGEIEKRRIHPAKCEIHVKFGVTSNGHYTFNFDARKKLKVPADSLKCEENM